MLAQRNRRDVARAPGVSDTRAPNMSRTRSTTAPPKHCACTGVRWCAECLDPRLRSAYKMDPPLELPPILREQPIPDGEDIFEFDLEHQCAPGCPEFSGLRVLPDFLSEKEAATLLDEIEQRPFAGAQSGKGKQHFGVKNNFNKRSMNIRGFAGLPRYAKTLERRFRQILHETEENARREGAVRRDTPAVVRALAAFEATDVFVLRYRETAASNLDLHVDDTRAYGEAILDVSLESDSALTFARIVADGNQRGAREDGEPRIVQNGRVHCFDDTPHSGRIEIVRAPLPARSAALLSGPARFDWEHGILAYDIEGRRTSVTLRTLSDDLRESEDGRRVLELARQVLD